MLNLTFGNEKACSCLLGVRGSWADEVSLTDITGLRDPFLLRLTLALNSDNVLLWADYGHRILQCVQKKRTTYFQTAVTPFKIDEITKAGRALKRAGADLSNAYNNFSDTQLEAKIFELKVDPVPKYFVKKYCR